MMSEDQCSDPGFEVKRSIRMPIRYTLDLEQQAMTGEFASMGVTARNKVAVRQRRWGQVAMRNGQTCTQEQQLTVQRGAVNNLY